MDRVAIVILNWNGIEDTLSCFHSLLKQKGRFRIVIVDNGSTDKSPAILRDLGLKHEDILTVLYNSVNKGFAGGVNKGIRWALKNNFDYVALINNDAVVTKDWIGALCNHLTDERGIITGLLLNDSGTRIDSTGEQYSIWGLAFPRNRGELAAKAAKDGEVFAATGGATLYRSKMLKEIGLFDENFFAYYEDVDISFRAQLAGWKVYYTSEAIAYHKQGASSSRMPSGFTAIQTFKNLPILFLKNVPLTLLPSIGARFLVAYLLMAGNAVRNGNSKAVITGIWRSIILIPHSLLERQKIQRAKRVPTRYIKSMLYTDLPPNQTGVRKVRRFFTGRSKR